MCFSGEVRERKKEEWETKIKGDLIAIALAWQTRHLCYEPVEAVTHIPSAVAQLLYVHPQKTKALEETVAASGVAGVSPEAFPMIAAVLHCAEHARVGDWPEIGKLQGLSLPS